MPLEYAERAFKVNPYTRWVYDHPEHLLPDPAPHLLEKRRREANTPHSQLVVELGSGSGDFLMEMGKRHPDTHFVGFELRFKRLVKSARKLEKSGLRNVWILRERGERLPEYFPPASIDGIFLNFPDPWPKTAQWKKRMVTQPFLDQLQSCLRPGGWFQLKTDHSGYFLHVLSLIHGCGEWNIRYFSNDVHRCGPPGDPVHTEFERLFAAKRKAIYFIRLEKSGA